MTTKLTLVSVYMDGKRSHVFKHCKKVAGGKTIAQAGTVNKLIIDCVGNIDATGKTFTLGG